MASNLTNQSRNVLSKKVMVKNEVILPSQLHHGFGTCWTEHFGFASQLN